MIRFYFTLILTLVLSTAAKAQVGEHRNVLAVGVSGGWNMSRVDFIPKVPQQMLGDWTAGITARYTSEKYFSSICAIVGEVNVSRTGWKENILDLNDQPVKLAADTTQALSYQRRLTYLQVPFLARMGWGREQRGFQFFVQAGPQFGFLIGEKTETNFSLGDATLQQRVSSVVAQDTMAVEHSIDYGISAGAGLEFSHPKVGHFLLEGRYYYGLGNLFGDSKRDYFGRSNLGVITVKLTYLFDVVK